MPITDLLSRVTDSTTGRPAVTSLGVGGKALGATSFSLADATNWTTSSVHYFAIYEIDAAGLKIQSSQTDWKGTLSGTTMSDLTLTGGTDKDYSQGAIVEVTPTARWAKDLYDNIRAHANQDGSLSTTAVQTALNIGSVPADYTPLANPPSAVTANGNRSYTLTFAGQDYTNVLSPGKRLMTTRTVAAPTQSTSLNGTNQYYSKTAPAGMTFTDDFVAGAWVKLSSYPTTNPARIISRHSGSAGWWFGINSSGQVALEGSPSAGNYSGVLSYQSIPLNKWVYVSAQLDMSAFTATSTTSYIMIDGVDVPAQVLRGGTNPTALVQAGNLEVGSLAGANFFSGKIAQAFVSSAKITQANIRTLISQGLTSSLISTHSIVSAYSFDNSVNDLNTTNANNLTASGAAVATNADSPFGGQGSGLISSTLDYAIVQTASYAASNTTVVCQVAEGCTIPTSGGVSAISYSGDKVPYGFPGALYKWRLEVIHKVDAQVSSPVNGTFYNMNSIKLTTPIGEWNMSYKAVAQAQNTAGNAEHIIGLSTSTSSQTEVDTKFWLYANNNAFNILPVSLSNYRASLSAETAYYIVSVSSTSSTTIALRSSTGSSMIYVDNSYL